MAAPEHPRLSRYEDLLSYVFPKAGKDLSKGQSTAQYSGTVLPPEGAHLGRSDPDRSAEKFCERALAGLRQFFAAHSMLDQPLPPSISDQIHRLATRQFARARIATEADVRTITVLLMTVVQDILIELPLAMGLDLQYSSSTGPWSQQAELDVVTSTSSSKSGARTICTQFALEEKKPSVLLAHSRAICEESYTFQRTKQLGGAKSILFKLYLHMNSMTPAAETGVVTDGFRVIFVEHYFHEGRHGFLTSPSYEMFQDGVVAQAQRAPIIALLLSLAIPGVPIERPSLPAEPVSVAVQEDAHTVPPPPATLVSFPASSTESTAAQDDVGSIPKAVYLVVDSKFPPSNTPDHPPAPVAIPRSQSSTTATSTSSIATRPSTDSRTSADILLASKLLHRGPDARTWLVRHGDGGRPYIAKVFDSQDGSWDQAVHEQAAIQAVRDRCGDIAPRALGLYRWPEGKGGLLLQEHGGMKLGESFHDLPQADRDAVWAIATSLHSKGIHHGDLDPANFVRGPDGVIRVLDFGQADLQHQCPGPGQCYELVYLNHDLASV